MQNLCPIDVNLRTTVLTVITVCALVTLLTITVIITSELTCGSQFAIVYYCISKCFSVYKELTHREGTGTLALNPGC